MVMEDYKQTEVGLIPESWIVKSLGELFNLKSGFSFKSEFFSPSGPIVLTPGNFRLNGGLYFNERNTKRYSGEFPRSTIFENGDLLIVMTDLTPDCNLLGKPAFVESDETILHNQRIGKIQLTTNLNKKFLYYMLLSDGYLQKIKDQATGSTVRHTSNKSIYSVLIPLPSRLEEQHAIAEALTDVDELIAGLDKLIAKKRAVKQAAMQQLLTGKTRLPGFGNGRGYKQTEIGLIPEDWKILSVGDIADFANGKPHESSVSKHGLFNLITLDSVDIDGSLKAEHKRIDFYDGSLKKNDIVIILSDLAHGNLLGLCDLIPTNAQYVLNQRVGRLRVLEGYSPQYIRLQINRNQNFFKTRGQGTSQKHIYKRDVAALRIPMPELKEQQSTSAVLYDMDAEITALEARRAKTQAIKQGMMQELLTGRIRLL